MYLTIAYVLECVGKALSIMFRVAIATLGFFFLILSGALVALPQILEGKNGSIVYLIIGLFIMDIVFLVKLFVIFKANYNIQKSTDQIKIAKAKRNHIIFIIIEAIPCTVIILLTEGFSWILLTIYLFIPLIHCIIALTTKKTPIQNTPGGVA